MFREDIDNAIRPEVSNYDIDGGSIPLELPANLFHQAVINDGNRVASRKNMHRHSYTCKKYGSTQCRFGCPWPLEPTSRIDSEG